MTLEDGTSTDELASDIIPWTIRNKYYTAEVHFQPVHLSLLPSLDLDDVPAIIYAWKENDVRFALVLYSWTLKHLSFAYFSFWQPYETHLKTVSEHLEENEHEPEVLLAVGLSPLPPEASEESFFNHGFEYIDGRSSVAATKSVSESIGK